MKSNGPPTTRDRTNPYNDIAYDAVDHPGEWQESPIPPTQANANVTAAYAAASTIFSIKQREGVIYIRYNGIGRVDTRLDAIADAYTASVDYPTEQTYRALAALLNALTDAES